jgi:hypothetical protein
MSPHLEFAASIHALVELLHQALEIPIGLLHLSRLPFLDYYELQSQQSLLQVAVS